MDNNLFLLNLLFFVKFNYILLTSYKKMKNSMMISCIFIFGMLAFTEAAKMERSIA
jgi:hypothetical protein